MLPSKLGTILVIDDDAGMQAVLRRIFVEENYSVITAGDGQSGLELFEKRRPLAVTLDLVLPQISGRELCERFKAMHPEIPVLVISAITDVLYKALLLELGADDYVTKPFSSRELMARVQAAIRRRKQRTPSTVYQFDDCAVDFEKMIALRSGVPVELTSHEIKLIRFFIEHPECVLTRDRLLNEVWGADTNTTVRSVDNQILKLRQKLEKDPANPKHLLTIYGSGYRFIP